MPTAKLWLVPLVDNICNEMQSPSSLILCISMTVLTCSTRWNIPPPPTTQEHINTIMLQTIGREYIHNMHELPSIELTIRYLHIATGFMVEETWLKAVQLGNYNFWPLINVTNVACYFPEWTETQKGHMRSQRQGVHSTKKKTLDVFPNTPTPPPYERKKDIFICIYKLKKTMYSNQMGLFLQVSNPGQQIHYCHSQCQQQLFVGGGPQGQQWRQTYPWPCTGPRAIVEGGHCPKTPSPGQPSISGIQKGHWQF